jgi:hypothetical protein
MTVRMPKATHTGTLTIGDLEIECAVLEDGRRVLSERSTNRALGRGRGGKDYRKRAELPGGGKLPVFLGANNLKPFIPDELLVVASSPILFRPTHRGRSAHGLEATVLPKILDVWLNAKDAGVLTPAQQRIAARAEILMRGLAHVGIIALVDEATGYQEDRDKQELQRILAAYISKELLPWAKRFPDEFYENLFRLRGWQYRPLSVRRPLLVGKLTSQLVYEKLPPGVLDELRRKNPVDQETKRRKHKHHQFLTVDIGNPHLQKQLVAVTTLMKVSANWREFKRHFARAFPLPGGVQTDFEFEENMDSNLEGTGK